MLAVRPKSAKAHVAAHVNGPRGSVVTNLTKVSEQQRDKLLLALLNTPPQPRPKRVRAKAKPIHAKRLAANKSASAL